MADNTERRIYLLSDEEISNILSGLHLLSDRLIKSNDADGVLFNNLLYDKVQNCYELGVILNEKR